MSLAAHFRLLICCIVLCSFLRTVFADIPVHCLIDQVYGAWNIHVTADGQTKSIDCSDAKSQIYGSDDFGLGKLKHPVVATWTLNLSYPNKATLTKDDGMMFGGTFTMIYDEGWEVRLRDNSYTTFFAFFYYDNNGGQCHRTFAGEMHSFNNPDGATWRCWYGEKKGSDSPPRKLQMTANSHLTSRLYQPEQTLVEYINSHPDIFTFKATLYMEYEGRIMEELHKMGRRTTYTEKSSLVRASKIFKNDLEMRHLDSETTESLSTSTSSWTGESSELSQNLPFKTRDHRIRLKPGEPLPERLDWRNVNGMNFMSNSLHQRACASCYAVSSVAILTARLRVKYGLDVPGSDFLHLSAQQLLDCNPLAQGCSGGFTFLTSRYAHQWGLVPETLYPYEASNSKCRLSQKSFNDKFVMRVIDYGHVGGFYGHSDAQKMMLALLDGPIDVNLRISQEFMFYKSGVIRGMDAKVREELDAVTMNAWESLDHSAILVGYDSDDQGPFWILQNSWGSNYGETYQGQGGYYKLQRGVNLMGIESLATWADVEYINIASSSSSLHWSVMLLLLSILFYLI